MQIGYKSYWVLLLSWEIYERWELFGFLERWGILEKGGWSRIGAITPLNNYVLRSPLKFRSPPPNLCFCSGSLQLFWSESFRSPSKIRGGGRGGGGLLPWFSKKLFSCTILNSNYLKRLIERTAGSWKLLHYHHNRLSTSSKHRKWNPCKTFKILNLDC